MVQSKYPNIDYVLLTVVDGVTQKVDFIDRFGTKARVVEFHNEMAPSSAISARLRMNLKSGNVQAAKSRLLRSDASVYYEGDFQCVSIMGVGGTATVMMTVMW